MKLTKLVNIAKKNGDEEEMKVLEYLERSTDDNKKSAIEYIRDRNDTKALKEGEGREERSKELLLVGKKDQYCNFLAAHGNELLNQAGFGQGWMYRAIPTDDNGVALFGRRYDSSVGVVFVLKSPHGQVFIQAMKATGVPDLDLEGIKRFSLSAENTMTDYENKLEKIERKPN